MADPEEVVTVYQAENVTEAHLMRNILEAEGIQAHVSDEAEPLAGLDITGPEVLVHIRDLDRAKKAIARYEELQIQRNEKQRPKNESR
jgi:hypothetical protein